MKKFLIVSLTLLLCTLLAMTFLSQTNAGKKLTALYLVKKPSPTVIVKKLPAKLKATTTAARTFIKKNNYNSSFYFLIDLSIPSNEKRFFIYDLQKDSIINSGLVTHGNCNKFWLEKVQYGNTVGCGCSSTGKYKVGHSYYGKFGLAFKLHGLDATNNKAFERYVVLHAHSCVPDAEVSNEICQSNGCPSVSPAFLSALQPLIKQSKKPVLLWIVAD